MLFQSHGSYHIYLSKLLYVIGYLTINSPFFILFSHISVSLMGIYIWFFPSDVELVKMKWNLSRRTSWTGERSQIPHRGVKFDLDLSIIYSFSVREDGACGLTPVWTWTWLSRINPALIARFENDTTNHVMSLLIISRESKQISQKVALGSHTFCHTQYNTTQS